MNKTLIRRLLALVMAAAVAMVYMPAAAPAFALTGEDGTVVSQEDGQGTTDGQENSGTDVTTDSQNTEQETVTTDKGEGGDGTENGSEGAAVTEPEEETTEGSSEFGLTDEEMENLRGIDSSDPSEEPGVKISVGKSKVTVHVNRVGTAGTAFVYRCDADEYYKTDNMHGMSASLNYDGDIVGIYDCGTTQDFEFNRYQKAGIDNLYCKYYIIKYNEILE